jgi:hypothetical protein
VLVIVLVLLYGTLNTRSIGFGVHIAWGVLYSDQLCVRCLRLDKRVGSVLVWISLPHSLYRVASAHADTEKEFLLECAWFILSPAFIGRPTRQT